MTPSELSAAQHRALAVLAAAQCTQRPCRASNRTTVPAAVSLLEMLTVHWKIADQLTDAGVVQVTNEVLQTLELTDTGRALAREAGL